MDRTRMIRVLKRPSTALLLIALVITITIAVLANAQLWRLYREALTPPVEASASSAETADALVVAVGRTSGGPQEWITLARVFSRVQSDTGRKIVLRYVPDMAEHEALMSDGQTDLALISVRAYAHLTTAGKDLTLVATPVVKGSERDAAVLVVPASSDARTLADLGGATVALSQDLVSTPYARWLLAQDDTTPEEFFGDIKSASNQDMALTLVSKGTVDAASVRRSALATWPKSAFRIVSESPEFGMPPLVARSGLDTATIEAVRKSLLAIENSGVIPEESAIHGFHQVSEAEYDFARTLDALETDHSWDIEPAR